LTVRFGGRPFDRRKDVKQRADEFKKTAAQAKRLGRSSRFRILAERLSSSRGPHGEEALSAMAEGMRRDIPARSLEDLRTLQVARSWLARHPDR